MSEPDPAARITAVLTQLESSLRRLRIPRADRRAVLADVRGDLETAAADGVDPRALIGPDVDAFARETVEAGGYRPRATSYARVVGGGGLAAVLGVVVAYVLVVVLATPVMAALFSLDSSFPTAGPVVALAAISVLAVLTALAALRWLMAGRPAGPATVRRAALLVPAAAALGVAAALLLVSRTDSTVGPTTVVALVAIPVLAALAASRWWALRSTADSPDTEGVRA
ncbi:hypothetical protein [Modestobacter sp. SYSU DS0290]